MALDRLTVYNTVRTRIGLSALPDLDKDPLLEIAGDEAEELILNYTNLDGVPTQARMVWIALAADIYRHNIRDFDLDKVESDGEEDGDKLDTMLTNVSEVKIDDAAVRDDITAVKYQSDASSPQAQQEANFLKNYRHRLQRFRRMQWRTM